MKETNINDLNTKLTEEESDIVDSIINDLNNDSDKNVDNIPHDHQGQGNQGQGQQGNQGQGQQGNQGQQGQQGQQGNQGQQGQQGNQGNRQKIIITPEQKNILESLNPEEQQNYLRNIKMKQMEQMENKMENKMENNELNNDKIKEIKNNAIEELKNKIKEPILITLITFLFSLPHVNKLFLLTKTKIFINEDGTITILSVLIKSILIGILYFLIKKYNLI